MVSTPCPASGSTTSGDRIGTCTVNYLDCEGEITGLEWLTPPAWLDEALALALDLDLAQVRGLHFDRYTLA